jgi:RNA polymerase sigma factor (sigma-70 family)
MTELLSGVDAPSDAELISRVRGGEVAAYGELFARHVDAARRLGRQLVRGTDVDDLVSDAFAKVLHVLQDGGGPDVAFRAYLLTSVRRLHIDRIRAAAKVQPSDDMAQFDNGIPFQDPAVARFENGAAAKAFASLPERWQLVLWHLEVEGQKPADIAPLLGMTPNSVSALAYRAREGLRQAFLTMHLADSAGDECRWVTEHLGAYVRKGLAKRDSTKVRSHLDQCRRCTAMYLELTEVNSNLAGIIAPLLLGAAAAGYVSSGSAASLTGVSAILGRARDLVTTNAGGGAAAGAGSTAVTSGGLLTAGAIAAGVAAVTSAALVFGGSGAKDVLVEADQTVRVVRTPPADGTTPDGVSSETEPAEPVDDVADDAPDDVAEVLADMDQPAVISSADAPPAASSDTAVGDDAPVAQPVGFTPVAPDPSPRPGQEPGAAPGPDRPDRPGTGEPGPGTEPPADGPRTEPAPEGPPTSPGNNGPAPGPDGPADEPGTNGPPPGDPGTSPPPDDDEEQPPSSPEPDVTPPLISVPPIVVDPPLLPPVATPPVDVPPSVTPPLVTPPPPVVIPDEPSAVEFGFVGAPLVVAAGGDSAAAGEHYYAVSLTFTGVSNGDELELVLSPQAGFCLEDGCAPGALENTKRVTVSGLADDTTAHIVTFRARFPGDSAVGVVATLNDGSPLPELVLR